MPSNAISAQQSVVRIRTGTGTSATITGVTKANPAVVTSTAHALADGTVVLVDNIVGMIELNGRAFVTTSSAANTFALKGVNSTNFTTYSSGGAAQIQTMSVLGDVKNFDVSPDESNEIDVTNLASVAKEFRLGLQGSWNGAFDISVVPTDTGQAEAAAARAAGALRAFTVTLSDGKVFVGVGYVKNITGKGSPDGVVEGQITVRGSNAPVWFA